MPCNYILYADKYTHEFENYCLENGLGKRCQEGVLLNKDIAYTYMSILAEIISKEMDRLGTIRREIQFYVPVDMYRIPLDEFINLRSNHRFETARRNFVAELNLVLDSYDQNNVEVDLNNVMECKREIYGLLKEIFISFTAVAVGVHSFGNMYMVDKGTLDFWEMLVM